MAKKPAAQRSSSSPKVLKAPSSPVAKGRHGRSFNASRAPRAFTDDPPGFTTEKDPRGKPDNTWFDLPPATGTPPYRVDLQSVLSDAAMAKLSKRMVFHAVGDTGGVNTTTYQQNVASYMELDFNDSDTQGANPAFFYHLGDVVYYDGEIKNYYWEFYEPYMHYPGPIFAIPGNHDGDVDPTDQFNQPSDSLKGFVRNFCAQATVRLPEAQDAPRDAMTQPNVFWTLNTPLATIIGLYTNVPEGGKLGQNQLDWFKQELAAAPDDRALILALHHPLYSAYGPHPGSLPMKNMVEESSKAAKRTPDLILAGHVHDYQRFTGNINGKQVPCIVAGAGGYNQKLHMLDRKMFDPKGVPYRMDSGPETLDSFNDFQHGYLLIDVRPNEILGSYIAVDDPTAAMPTPTAPAKPYDTFTISL
jgi:acid phosphatase type 7